ncbi:MAG: class I SAM-dependent methyltransferase [Candidatus Binataceae bacterium]
MQHSVRRVLRYLPMKRQALQLIRRLPNRLWFSQIYHRGLWHDQETVSGCGSTLEFTASLRQSLAKLLRELNVHRIVDAGCGDFNWMRHVDLSGIDYIGVDVVPRLVRELKKCYTAPKRQFLAGDITRHLPRCDLVLCRHVMIHLPNRDILRFFKAIRGSGARYLLATSAPAVSCNPDIWRGSFRLINLERSPFNLPKPSRILMDQNVQLGLWETKDIQ